MKLEGLTFDEAMEQLENTIGKLEKDDDADNQELYEEAIALKEYCSELLRREKEDIIKIAKENNIALSDIGLENSEDEDIEDMANEENEDDEVSDAESDAIR